MTTNKFSLNELNTLRPVLEVYGNLYGKGLIAPVGDNLDLSFNEKVQNGVNPRFASPIKKYSTKLIVMTSFKLDKDPNERPVLIINDDPSLTFPLKVNEDPKVSDCTPDKINEAIRSYVSEKKLVFFTDIEAVSKIVMQLNEQNASDLEEFAEECLNFARALRDINSSERMAKDEYIKSLKKI